MSSSILPAVMVPDAHPAAAAAAAKRPQQYVGLQMFTKCSPMALGTVQIMVGLVTALFGTPAGFAGGSLNFVGGLFAWGAVFHITAGSLTVAAGKRPTRCLVVLALSFNVAAALIACGSFVVDIIDAVVGLVCRGRLCPYGQMTSAVLAVFDMLEIMVSAVVAGCACRCICSINDSLAAVVVSPGVLATDESSALISPQNVPDAEESASASRPRPHSAVIS